MMQEPPWMPRTEEEYRQQLAEDAGPQPDEMIRLQMALDAAESVAQMAAEERDEAQQAADEIAADLRRLQDACRGLFVTWKPGEPNLEQVLKRIHAELER